MRLKAVTGIVLTTLFFVAASTMNISVGVADDFIVVATIPVGDGPAGVAVNPSTNRIYVANWYSDDVSVIDGATNGVFPPVDVGEEPLYVAVNPTTNRSYVTNQMDDTVSVIQAPPVLPTYALTITTTTGGTTNPSPGKYARFEGTIVKVTAIPDTNYVFNHWELDGSWDYSNPISVTMDSHHTLHAVFTYNVTIKAHCYTEGAPVSVSITMDGSPTGYNTPHTFTGLEGTHNFTVLSTDPPDLVFWRWSTGETSTTITVTTGGTYTAYYYIPRGGWNLAVLARKGVCPCLR